MTKKEQHPIYVSPLVKIMKIKTHAIICQSGGNRSMGENELNEDDFEQL
mgnify:CR=1 FL=1